MVEILATTHVVVDGEARGEVADAATNLYRVLDDVESEHRGRSTGRVEETEEGSNGGALPRAVWPEEAEEFALLDLEVNRRERLDLTRAPVVLGERTSLDGKGVCHGRKFTPFKNFSTALTQRR